MLVSCSEVVSEDIDNFEYSPRPDYPGVFTVFNEANEVSEHLCHEKSYDSHLVHIQEALLRRWFTHMQELKPLVYVTYNGDYFDWPFIDARARIHHMSLKKELGFQQENDEYVCTYASHLDAIYWVKRDSYLPQGSHGLKVPS